MSRIIPSILVFTVAMTWLCLTAGCQEQVVSRRISSSPGVPGAADYRYVKAKPRRTNEKGMFEGMGDFLFGWTDDLFKENPTPPARTTQNVKPIAPATPATTPQDQWKAGQWQTVTPKQ